MFLCRFIYNFSFVLQMSVLVVLFTLSLKCLFKMAHPGPYLDDLKHKCLTAKRKLLCGRFYSDVDIVTADKLLLRPDANLKWVGLKHVGVFWA